MDSTCRSCGDDSECVDGSGTYSSCDRTGTDPSGYTFGVCSNCGPGNSCAKGRCENYKCVECYSDSECPYTAPVCDIQYESNFCVGCSLNSECTTPGYSVCSGSGSCARCSTNSECSHIANYKTCNPSVGCVECTQDSHCTTAGKPYCDLETNVCTIKEEEASTATQAVVKTIETTAKTMMGVSGSMMFAGANPALLWALISLLQAFYYLIFINVNYPENVEAFFALFKLGNFSFIPNPIGWFFSDIDEETLPAPKRFTENQVDGVFLQNTGNMLLIWVVVILLYLVAKLFVVYTRNMPRFWSALCYKVVGYIEWSGALRTIITSYTQINMAVLLQLRTLNFNNTLFSLSSGFAIVFLLLSIICPIVVFDLIRKFYWKPGIFKAKYFTLVEEYRLSDKIPKYFTLFFLIRRFCLGMILVFLYDSPNAAVSLLLVSCIIWCCMIYWYLPHEGKWNNIVNLGSEIVFTVIHILILLLSIDETEVLFTDQGRKTIGWVMIGLAVVIIISSLVVSVVQQVVVLLGLVRMLTKLIKGKRGGGQASQKVRKRMRLKISPEPPKGRENNLKKKAIFEGNQYSRRRSSGRRETEIDIIDASMNSARDQLINSVIISRRDQVIMPAFPVKRKITNTKRTKK